MATKVTGPRKSAVAVLATIAVLVAGTPGSPAHADADLRLVGGTAVTSVVCGNVAAAQTLAGQRGVPLQKSRCTARATGGSVTLRNVDILVSSAALARNRANPLIAALTDVTAAATIAEDTCDSHRTAPAPGVQLNKCWALGRGGKVRLSNVTMINRGATGTTTRTVNGVLVPSGAGRASAAGGTGSASASCANVVNHPVNQRDDCTGAGAGGSWSMWGVDAVVRDPDGSTSTRRAITVEVRGGDATASIHCFNVVDGAGRVIQINICDGDATGGDAVLQNVTITTTS